MAYSARFINREISWLAFNHRVLQESEDKSVPLIERIRFLGIFSNNLDEFYRVRVASVMLHKGKGDEALDQSGLSPKKLLNKINIEVNKQQQQAQEAFHAIRDEFSDEGIVISNIDIISDEQKKYIKEYFKQKIRSVIVPYIFSEDKPLPILSDKSVYLATILRAKLKSAEDTHALIRIPSEEIGRFIVLPSDDMKVHLIFLDDVIRICIDEIFYSFTYSNAELYSIKITRGAELEIDSDITKSFLVKISESVHKRERTAPVRFIYDSKMPDDFRDMLVKKFKVSKLQNVISGRRYHNFKDFMDFPDVGGKFLKYSDLVPVVVPDTADDKSFLKSISEGDKLLYYPYHSFDYLLDLLREAAIDPNVIKIKISLYRVAKNSKVINALINAAFNGKEVTVAIEIQARFDELNNIEMANRLQAEGVNVIFSEPGLKVHSKICLITRIEKNKEVQYANVSTGNYHEGTSKYYCDFSLFTKDKRITNEVGKVFSFIKKTIKPPKFKHLMVSPNQLKSNLIKHIDKEIKSAQKGEKAYIKVKLNSLIEADIINKLYEASEAGVEVKLIVRSLLSIVPERKGLSSNIQAISIVDRYLEHGRCYIFYAGGKEKVYIASADWMDRNFDRRIEVACPIYDDEAKKTILDIFEIQWKDNIKARKWDASLKNVYRKSGKDKVRSQIHTYEYFQAKNDKYL